MTNQRLNELLKINPNNLTDDNLKEFFNEVKKSSLLLAIDSNTDVNKPLKLNQDDENFICIFTDEEEVNSFGAVNFIRYDGEDLIDLLMEEDNIDNIVINPASENPFGMSYDFFISNLKEDKFEQLAMLADAVRKGVKPTDEISIYYLREQTPFMFENSNEDVFTSPIPFCVSSDKDFNGYLPILNEIYVPKGIMFAENPISDLGEVILAPLIRFRLIEKTDDNTYVWQCINQDFNIF